MKRSEAREQAFILIFEYSFNNSVKQVLDCAALVRDLEIDGYAKTLLEGVDKHKEEIDFLIEKKLVSWQKNRLSRVALAIMRLSIFEIKFLSDIPVGVSINEAVELAKKYSGQEEASFVNGVLGSIARGNNT